MKSTERLYYADSFMTRFSARVADVAGNRVYLDRTAFYPTSGGQPFDLGTLSGTPAVARVVEVLDEEERIAHVIEGDAPSVGEEVTGELDWTRRRDHMQQHSGQHLLSAALEELFGIATVSFHMGAEASTIDVAAAALSAEQLVALEQRANELIQENRAMGVAYEDAAEAGGLRKASERQGTLRIVTIDGLDRSACGGTHVRATGEIGALLLRKIEKIRNTVRVEFLCGMRAARRARLDYDALSAAARTFSSPLDQVPVLAAAMAARVAESEKARQRLEVALAVEAGRALYRATAPGPNGMRFVAEAVPAMDDAVRARSNGFVEGQRAAYLATCVAGPSYLLVVSPDAEMGAAQAAKAVVEALGGKGGGTAAMAQGRLAAAERLTDFEAAIRALLAQS